VLLCCLLFSKNITDAMKADCFKKLLYFLIVYRLVFLDICDSRFLMLGCVVLVFTTKLAVQTLIVSWVFC